MNDPFEAIDALLDEDRLEEAERLILKESPRADEATRFDLHRQLAWIRLELGRPKEALEAARAVGDRLYEGKALFHLWEFPASRRALEAAADEEEGGEAEWYLGLLDEFEGKDPTKRFRRAATLEPELFAPPPRLSDAEIDRVVSRALEGLPPEVREAVEETAIEVVPLPRPHPDVDPLSLGLYLGTNALERSVDGAPGLPPRIEIYRRNIERIARDRDEAVEELRITLLHEIGHHLGYDEEGVAGLGLA